MLRRLVPACMLLCAPLASADTPNATVYGTDRTVVVKPVSPDDKIDHALISPIIYLNRCVGGCELRGTAVGQQVGEDDASTTIPTSGLLEGTKTLSEFSHSQATWDALVQCMREIYSPYEVQITETRPGPGTQYHMAVIAGTSQEAGKPNGVLGQAIVRGDCAPRNNAVSLSFANSHVPNDPQLVYTLCHTVGQESAHAFGLDHSFKWLDGRSTCNDPMTYQGDCGGQRFFRNETATCGESSMRQCNCGSTQNSHAKILLTFGPSTAAPLIPPPTSAITAPAANQALPAMVTANAGSKRGVDKVELIINGFKWAEVKGAKFGANGQPNPSMYSIPVPADVPASKIDLVVRAYDDLGAMTDSAVVQTYKGNPAGCVDATTCAKGQKCEAGKCFWDPPVGQVGDSCEYPQFCESLMCEGEEGAKVCSQNCVPGTADACPMGLQCIPTGTTAGYCYTKDDSGGGCCSVGDDDGSRWFVHGGLSILMLGLLLRRRRPARRK